jgi:general secretion pathway protein H
MSSPSRAGTTLRAPRGLTLIELMVALAVAAALFSAVVLGLGALTGARARKAMGELGAAARSLYDTAALTGNTCRLVFLLPRDDSAEFSYRAECAKGPVTSAMDRDQEIRDATKAAVEAYRKNSRGGARATEPAPDPRSAASGSGAYGPYGSYGSSGSSGSSLLDVLDAEKARVEKAAAFSAFTTAEIQPRKMNGVRVSVWTSHQRAKIDTGLAYLYFFPQGYTERAQVTVRQGKNVWTLLVSPFTGKTSIVDGEPEIPKS